jgi:GDP-D-mannose 3', 5'-epimerase
VKKALVCGAGGFIGGHLTHRLREEGYWVRGVDLKLHEFAPSNADEFVQGDLRDQATVRRVLDQSFDEIYQLAADMGGAGYIFTGENDAEVMHNSAIINLNVLHRAQETLSRKIFYSSSACIYPAHNQQDPGKPNCREDSVYPAAPDSDHGWEKLFSERLYLAFHRNHGTQARIARLHNTFGPLGAWAGGRENAPAALCRKVVEAQDQDEIEIWGDGEQTRSFLYIDECLEGMRRLMDSEFTGPVNIGSEEMITINALAEMAISISGKRLVLKHIPGPLGVRGRNSDNHLILEKLGWQPSEPLASGMKKTYAWIAEQVRLEQKSAVSGSFVPC